jgi:substrate import-associated zinc metallohydrolase lipoprotein
MMNKIHLYFFALLLAGAVGAASCNKSEISGESIFVDPVENLTDFDMWLLNNYTYPYNIEFKYKMEFIESDMSYQLSPAKVENAIALAKLIKYLWLDAYDEHAGASFLRTYVPRVIHLVGSGAYNANNTVMLGTAEGGMKITLYDINGLNIDNISIDQLNDRYLRTMHHEFAHILHQTKNYPVEFQLITKTDYIGQDWSTYNPEGNINVIAWQKGFISAYSRSAPDEDFVELIAHYITNPAEWNYRLNQAGATGRALLEQKIDMVKGYLRSAWHIDLDTLRDVVQERALNIEKLNLKTL